MEKLTTVTRWHFIILSIIVMLISAFLYRNYIDNIHQYKANKHHDLQLQLKSVFFSYNLLTDHIYQSQINNPEVAKLLLKASQTNNLKIQSELRSSLYEKFLPLYNNLHSLHIRQFHFHLPQGISFLRFHRYRKFGDSILDIRPSIAMVNKNHKKISGFEEGRAANGFRNVFPIFHNDDFVGSVEISFSFSALKITGMKLYPASYRLILEKSLVNDKIWEDEKNNYKVSDISPQYLYDKEALSSQNILSNKVLSALNLKLKKHVGNTLGKKIFISYFIENNNKSYLVTLMPLVNIKGNNVGYFIIYKEDNTKSNIQTQFYYQLLGLLLFTLVVLILFLLYRHHKQILIFAKKQHELSQLDALTQISNRAFFQEMAPQLIDHAKNNNYNLGVIFFDIDHFKNINDTYGHNTGDLVLRELSRVVKQQIREEDCFSRWGGEEFVLILSRVSQEDAKSIANKIRSAINSYKFSDIKQVTCSFGITQLKSKDTLFSLMERADVALYKAKNEGRDCIRIKL